MGNLSFLHPTTNKEEFNLESIAKILIDNGFEIEALPEWNEIRVLLPHAQDEDNYVCSIYFDQENYLLDTLDEDIADPENKEYKRNLVNFKKEADTKCIQISYGYNDDNRQKVVRFLHKYFKTYWLDEGIHPELIEPNYKFKREMA